MNVLVVGATGRTGGEVVRAARAAGHHVRAFARSAGRVAWPAGVEAAPGDVLVQADVDRAMAGMDAVIVAISMVRTSDWPWARILTPTDLHVRAAACLTEAARRHGLKAYVTVSAQGVGDSAKRAGWFVLALVRSSNIGVAYSDLARAEGVVRGSGLPWTIVRPTRLTGGAATGRWAAGPDRITWSVDRIRRADVAEFLVAEAEHGTHRGTSVTVTRAT